MAAPKVVRIFISSPSDVRPERLIAARVIERLGRELAYHFRVEAVLWEREPLLATHHFQDIENIPAPRSTDVVVVILWSRLGVPLPEDQFRGAISGRPVTGTEWEFEDALKAAHDGGVPHLMVYRKNLPVTATLDDDAALERQRAQKKLVDGFIQRWFKTADAKSFTAAFRSFRTPTEFEDQLYEHLHALLERRVEGAAPAGAGEAAVIRWHQEPFRGLQSFELEHAQVFFGRTRARNELRELLTRQAALGSAFVMVLGASGSGKSSVVKAGLLPDLMLPGMIGRVALCRYAVMRPSGGQDGVLAALAAALLAPTALPELAELHYTAERLAALLREAPAHAVLPLEQGLAAAAKAAQVTQIGEARIAIVVDQLEELFTADAADAEREAFVAALTVLAGSGRAFVIATMRSDFFDRLEQNPALMQLAAGEARYLLAAPDEGEVRQMIVQPAREAGLRYEFDARTGEELADIIHAQAVRDRGALPLLSFVLDQLWRRRTDHGVLTFAAYDELGGLAGALGRRADEVYAAQSEPVRAALPAVLRALVTVGQGEQAAPTARPVRLDRFASGSPERRLVEAFLAPTARLLVADGAAGGAAQLRVAHEALLTHWPKAREVLAEAMADLKLRARVEQAAESWRSAPTRDRPSFLLQPGRPLAEAEDLLRRFGDELGAEVRDFVSTSLRARQRSLRRRVAAAAVLSGGIAASLVGGYYYGREWLTYRQERRAEAARTDLQGTTIAYSTSKGTIALDALPGESHSPYLAALLRLIGDPTLDLNSLLLKVNQDVITRTRAAGSFGAGGTQMVQIPEFQTTLNGAVYLHDPPPSRQTFVLSIGIAAYRNVPPLATSTGDAQSVAEAMRAMGYQVDLVLDPDHSKLAAAATAFEQRIAEARSAPGARLLAGTSPQKTPPGDHRGLSMTPSVGVAPLSDSLAIVYISADGFETGDQMLVAPTDVTPPSGDGAFLASMLSVNDLVERLRKLTAVQIVIVDTCRDDPLAAAASAKR